MAALARYFKLEERNTTVLQEVRAGTATFLTMSYILLVNPQLLSKLSVPPTDIVISTAVASAVGSFICGVFGNLPFGLGPGFGLSAYLTYGLVMGGDGLTLQQAFTSCFVAGLVLLVLSVTGVASVVMNLIPQAVKVGTIVGMGLQIALVGMTRYSLFSLWCCVCVLHVLTPTRVRQRGPHCGQQHDPGGPGRGAHVQGNNHLSRPPPLAPQATTLIHALHWL